MVGNSQKRRAADQLSPYSQDPEDEPVQESILNEPPIVVRKARARKNKESINKESLKGIFGNVSLTSQGDFSNCNKQKEDVIAGINKSFLKAIELVISKQSNKDLTYLFKQYEKFIREIKQNNKE